MEVRRITVAEFFAHPDSKALLAEYSEECAWEQLGAAQPNDRLYSVLEASGFLTVYVVESLNRLYGFGVLVACENPHYSQLLASTESLFVARARRASGAGLKLLMRLEEEAEKLGARAFMVSAPVGSKLDQTLGHAGYKHKSNHWMTPCRTQH